MIGKDISKQFKHNKRGWTVGVGFDKENEKYWLSLGGIKVQQLPQAK